MAESVAVEVSFGELIDKITILEIKLERIDDPAKLKNLRAEWETLTASRDAAVAGSSELTALSDELKRVNDALWAIEDDIRDCERAGDFGDKFVELARAVYVTNDQRADLKRQINILLGSRLVEEKSYAAY